MSIRLPAIVLVAAAIASPSQAEPAQRPPVEAFAMLPIIGDVALSPDGKHLAMVQPFKGRPIVTITKLDQPEAKPAALAYEDALIDNVRWANDHRLLVTSNVNIHVGLDDVYPAWRTVAVDPNAKNSVLLFKNMQMARRYNGSTSEIADLALNEPDQIYMPLWTPVSGFYNDVEIRDVLYRVDLNTGAAEPVQRGSKYTTGWLLDGSGHAVVRFDHTQSPLTDHIMVPDGSDWRDIAKTDASGGHGFAVSGLSADGKSLVMGRTATANGTYGLSLMSLADGSLSLLYSDTHYDVDSTINDPWTQRVVGARYIVHQPKTVYFEADLRSLQETLEAGFPGMTVQIMSWDVARNTFVIGVDSPTSPRNYYLFDRRSKQAQMIGPTYPLLRTSDLGEVRVYDYKARDGLDIPAYLTVPPGKDVKNLPVVVLPHGGPMARDDMRFDWESQFLANRGYAVLRPNFRGSSGYGLAFEEAGYGQWGLKMQDDITDGVKKLIADGIADPKRICIVGGSYGGYAALAGAALTPDLYACAASWAGIGDLRHMLATDTRGSSEYSAYVSAMSRFIGNRRDEADKLDAVSPAMNIAKIRVPILLMHGEADTTVNIDQSEAMNRLLTNAHKPVTFIRIPTETHHMKLASTRVRWLTELEKFLKANIGN